MHIFSVIQSRRRLLQLALTSACTAALPGRAWSQSRFASDPFKLGVASGSPRHDSVVLWTRLWQQNWLGQSSLGSAAIPVRWEIAQDEQFSRVVQSGQVLALAELAHAVHVQVAGLAADRWYFYRFSAGDARSRVGRTRSLAAPGAEVAKLRLAYASCQRWEHGFFSAYRHMRQEELDLVLFLGDYIYEYPNAANAVRTPTGGWVSTLDDYRARYALHKTDADLQEMHAACPWLMTWDDHEVQNDYAGSHAGDSGPLVADFAARRVAAYQAYYEHMPLRTEVLRQGMAGLASGAELRLYGSVTCGQLATFYMLDDRQYRDPQVCTPGGKTGSGKLDPKTCPEWRDARRSLLGAAQEQWLTQAFSQGSRGWNVIAQQTLFGPRDFRIGREQSFWNDGWDGYPAARERLIASLLLQRLANPVLLGGDVHSNWVGHVKADYSDPASAAIGVEFCGTGISARSSSSDPKLAARLAKNPHFIYADSQRNGYGVLELTPKQLRASLRAVLDVRRPDSGIETLAQFEVEAGKAQLMRKL